MFVSLLAGAAWSLAGCATSTTTTTTPRATSAVAGTATVGARRLAADARLPDPARFFKGPAWAVLSEADLAAFDEIWVVSDLHGRGDILENLLATADLTTDATGKGTWHAKNKLLVIAGDCVDGGDDGIQIILRVEALSKQAQANGSRIISLLGNHEARLLSDLHPKSLEKETLASYARALGVSTDQLDKDTIKHSHPTELMRQYQVGAVLGHWLVAHSGSLRTDAAGAAAFLASIDASWEKQSKDGFAELSDVDGKGVASILSRHDWWDKEKDDLHNLLLTLGISGLIVGHEPSLMGSQYRDHVTQSSKGWAIKTDSGVKDNPRARGEMLRCPKGANGFQLQDGDKSACFRHPVGKAETSLDKDP